MAGRLAGKVAVVSGGARGMGASHVRALVDEGAKVVFGDILDAEGEAVAKDVGGADALRAPRRHPTRATGSASSPPRSSEFGGVDILVNNAGIINVGLIEDYELSEWQRILDINLTGVFLGIRAVVEPMKAAGRGSIINISSIEGMAGTIACHGYTATKFAVRGLTKSTASGVGAQRNSGQLDPPGIDQDPDDRVGARRHLPDRTGPCRRARGRCPTSSIYLASDESSYSTGSEFVVDGGCTAGLGHKDFSAVETEQQPEWVT